MKSYHPARRASGPRPRCLSRSIHFLLVGGIGLSTVVALIGLSRICSYAHVLAEAVQALFPGTQITFGPATDDGFYYDFAPKDRPFTDEDLPAIEAEMRKYEQVRQQRRKGASA